MRRVVAYIDPLGNCHPTDDSTSINSPLSCPEQYKCDDVFPADPDVLEMLLKNGVSAKDLLLMREAGLI